MDIKAIDILSKEAAQCYKDYDYINALGKINHVLALDKNNRYGMHLKACILIDSWDKSIQNKAQILEAICHLKKLLKDEDPLNKWVFLGNIGNAYFELARSELKNNGSFLDKIILKDIFRAKDYYQESLELHEKQPHIWINKGNLLNTIGRYLEAIECYDRAILIYNRHYNSWGNRGFGYLRLSRFATDKDDRGFLYAHGMNYIGIELMLHPDFGISDDFKDYVSGLISNSSQNYLNPF